ncbi:MAG TPA: DUF2089 domain-containing protein [Acholeplasma sp.]|nr:DUF2089 domain-containing protein [Acholeplasma sp.]
MKNLNPVITCCPVCNHDLHITHLECDHCHTKIQGDFGFSKFNYLTPETLLFIELFVKNRGNIKSVEKEMNVSYPTVKKYLEEAIVALGYKPDADENDEAIDEIHTAKAEGKKAVVLDAKQLKLDILDKIKDGSLSVEEALGKIKNLKGGK